LQHAARDASRAGAEFKTICTCMAITTITATHNSAFTLHIILKKKKEHRMKNVEGLLHVMVVFGEKGIYYN